MLGTSAIAASLSDGLRDDCRIHSTASGMCLLLAFSRFLFLALTELSQEPLWGNRHQIREKTAYLSIPTLLLPLSDKINRQHKDKAQAINGTI